MLVRERVGMQEPMPPLHLQTTEVLFSMTPHASRRGEVSDSVYSGGGRVLSSNEVSVCKTGEKGKQEMKEDLVGRNLEGTFSLHFVLTLIPLPSCRPPGLSRSSPKGLLREGVFRLRHSCRRSATGALCSASLLVNHRG